MKRQHSMAQQSWGDNSISCLHLCTTSTWPAPVVFADDQPTQSDGILGSLRERNQHADWLRGLQQVNGMGGGGFCFYFSSEIAFRVIAVENQQWFNFRIYTKANYSSLLYSLTMRLVCINDCNHLSRSRSTSLTTCNFISGFVCYEIS